jgi:hypothetical protein
MSAIVLILVGGGAFYLINELPEELKGSQWSGKAVAYYFFAHNMTYGLALLLSVVFLKKQTYPLIKKYKSIIIIALAVCAFIYFDRVVIYGRRGTTLTLVFIFLLGNHFFKRHFIKQRYVLLFAIIGTLMIHSIFQYRALVSSGISPLESMRSIEFTSNLKSLVNTGGSEVDNAINIISESHRQSKFDFGLFHWNTLIFNYVPAQIFGENFKNGLKIPVAEPSDLLPSYYSRLNGSTNTGLADSFYSFWFFGAIKFFMIAFFMQIIYMRGWLGSYKYAIFYILMIVPALHTITHHTHWFISPWVHMFIFLVPLLYYSSNRKYVVQPIQN